jgi:hypothetical protein
VIGQGITTLPAATFSSDSDLVSVTIPDTVTSIGGGAFTGCDSLTNIVIPASVTNINNGLSSSGLQNIFFLGNAPTIPYLTAFIGDPATAYYLPGTSGWTNFLNLSPGIPLVEWDALISTTDGHFGFQGNQFGFDVVASKGLPIIVQSSPTLISTNWATLGAVTLTNGSLYYSEPFQTNSPTRFYRVSWPD